MHNIERSAFRKGQHVGYAGGKVFKVWKDGKRWQAVSHDRQHMVFGSTLAAISAQLDNIALELRAANISNALPNPFAS